MQFLRIFFHLSAALTHGTLPHTQKPHAQRARAITPKTAAIIAAPFSSRIYVFSQAVRLLFMRLRTFLRNLSAPAAKRKQAVHAKISIAAGNALRAGVAAHLFIFVVRGRAFVLVFRRALFVIVLRVKFPVRVAVFLLSPSRSMAISSCFCTRSSSSFIEHARLKIMPFRVSFVECVEFRLRFVDLPVFQKGSHFVERRASVFGICLLRPRRFDFRVGVFQFRKVLRAFVARFAVEPAILLIFLFSSAYRFLISSSLAFSSTPRKL